jgi:hypothetical protein
VTGEGDLAGGGHIDGVDSLGDETFVTGGVEALDEDGLGCKIEKQVKLGLNLEHKFLVGNDVVWAQFQSSHVILGAEGTQTGGLEFILQNAFLLTEVEGGGLLAAGQRCQANFSVQPGLGSTGKRE